MRASRVITSARLALGARRSEALRSGGRPPTPGAWGIDRTRTLRASAHAVAQRGNIVVAAELRVQVDVRGHERAAGEAQAAEVAVELEAGAPELLPVLAPVAVPPSLRAPPAAVALALILPTTSADAARGHEIPVATDAAGGAHVAASTCF
jgi:hypothetical protein